MKSLKIALASVTFVVAVVILSSFAATKYDSAAFTRVCYEYIGPNPATPSVAQLQTPGNWRVFTGVAPSETEINLSLCPDASKLCIICFDDANTSFSDAIALLVAHIQSSTIGALADPAVLSNGTKSVKVFQFL